VILSNFLFLTSFLVIILSTVTLQHLVIIFLSCFLFPNLFVVFYSPSPSLSLLFAYISHTFSAVVVRLITTSPPFLSLAILSDLPSLSSYLAPLSVIQTFLPFDGDVFAIPPPLLQFPISVFPRRQAHFCSYVPLLVLQRRFVRVTFTFYPLHRRSFSHFSLHETVWAQPFGS